MKFALRELTLAAGKSQRVDEVASFFVLVSNTGEKNIKISIDDDPFSECPVGYEYRELKEGSFYKHIDFKNPNTVEVTIKYIMSTGLVRISPIENVSVIDIADTIETPVPIELNAGNSYTASISADTTQKGLIIQNTGSNECWYGKQADHIDPATKRGTKFDVGSKEFLPITCTLFFKSPTLDCTISYNRLQKKV